MLRQDLLNVTHFDLWTHFFIFDGPRIKKQIAPPTRIATPTRIRANPTSSMAAAPKVDFLPLLPNDEQGLTADW
jgi:hypothetical protein